MNVDQHVQCGDYQVVGRKIHTRRYMSHNLYRKLHNILDKSKGINIIINIRTSFLHWKTGALSASISISHAMFIQVFFQTGVGYGIWLKVLTFMLLEISVIIQEDKLRAILLLEADFNLTNKLYFGFHPIKTRSFQESY